MRAVRLVDEQDHRLTQLSQIVRRNGRRHPHGNAARAIGQQIGKAAGEDDGRGLYASLSLAEWDGVFGEAIHQNAREFR